MVAGPVSVSTVCTKTMTVNKSQVTTARNLDYTTGTGDKVPVPCHAAAADLRVWQGSTATHPPRGAYRRPAVKSNRVARCDTKG